MNANFSKRRQVNEIHFTPLVRWLILALVITASGFLFVYVKNQQHALGEQTRRVERQIRETKALNEVLLARISTLSSRTTLQRKLEQGLIALKPIEDHCIARLSPPAAAKDEGLILTAANRRAAQ